MRKALLLRTVLALVFVGLLLWVVDIEKLLAALLQVKLEFVFYLAVLAVVMIWISCVKWQLFIRAAGHNAGLLTLMHYYTVGYFFNTFTPSYVGGDLARSYKLGKEIKNQKDAFASTFLERFTGLLAMSLLGVCSVLLGAPATAGLELAILLLGLGALILATMCFSKRFAAMVIARSLSLLSLVGLSKFSLKLQPFLTKIDRALDVGRGSPGLLVKAMILSLAFHVLTVVNTYVAGLAVGWSEPSFLGLFVAVPLVLLVGMVPITPSGIGVQEGAFLFLLKRVGATEAQGLGVGIVLRAKVILIAVLGGLLLLFVQKKPEASRAEAV